MQTHAVCPGHAVEHSWQAYCREYNDKVSVGQEESGCAGKIPLLEKVDFTVYSDEVVEENEGCERH